MNGFLKFSDNKARDIFFDDYCDKLSAKLTKSSLHPIIIIENANKIDLVTIKSAKVQWFEDQKFTN